MTIEDRVAALKAESAAVASELGRADPLASWSGARESEYERGQRESRERRGVGASVRTRAADVGESEYERGQRESRERRGLAS
jgi:hypothetical protein